MSKTNRTRPKTATSQLRQSVKNHPRIRSWLVDPLIREVAQRLLNLAESIDVRQIAVLPDVHLAGDYCVGTAMATERLIYPQSIGGDIGCGMAAIQLNASADLLLESNRAETVLDGLRQSVPAIRRRSDDRVASPETPASAGLSHPRLRKIFAREGVAQLGTLGRGNHFLEFQSDEEGQLWLMIHSGSRGMGKAVADHHLRECQPGCHRFVTIESGSPAGQRLLNDYDWAAKYAAANRRCILSATVQFLTTQFGVTSIDSSLIESDHNHIRRESITIDGTSSEVWMHRKGAQQASAGQLGLIPGSMAAASYHVIGRGEPSSLDSCSHGAGRTMSRKQAFERVTKRQLIREMSDVVFDSRRADQLRDESPSTYRDIRKVIKSQRDLISVERRLKPILSFKY